ncbi:MAG: DUF2244 domain-containing protein [Rhodospirillales bacterium]|nr:DUF2244 domain-containing protein [Rhodospirillales bacterium]
MVISVYDKTPHPSEPDVQIMNLDIRLTPSVAERLPFVRWSLSLFGAVCLLVGLVFMSLGAQPVLGFMGLEVVLLYAVYKYCEGNARQNEHVTVCEQHFIVRTTDRYGRLSLARFDPRWTDLRLASHERGGGLIVFCKGRTRRFGDFLDLAERDTVLDLLHRALRRVPGG